MRAGRAASQAVRLPGEGKGSVPAEPAKARAFFVFEAFTFEISRQVNPKILSYFVELFYDVIDLHGVDPLAMMEAKKEAQEQLRDIENAKQRAQELVTLSDSSNSSSAWAGLACMVQSGLELE
jgi:hypothetical protein